VTRYSQLYVERGRRQPDSQRARIRLHALFASLLPADHQAKVQEDITLELGVEPVGMPAFFKECDVHDLLDAVTVIYDYLHSNDDYLSKKSSDDYNPYEAWRNEVDRIFREEHLAYRLDDGAVVRPGIDTEFEVNRASALEVLDDPRFGEARTEFKAAYRHLGDGNGKEALRMMFPAVEVVAKVLFPGAFPRFMPNEVDRHLRPRLERRYANNAPAISAGRLLLEGMKNWISAAQLYRHGQQQQEPAAPPMDFVVAHLSAGATYLRWMIELCSDQGTSPA
jgi:hypothetical protein